MENKNYYPLRIGQVPGTILSDIPCHNMDNANMKYYGGHLVAESLPSPQLAKQLVDAYNEKYEPKEISSDTEKQVRFLSRVESFVVVHGHGVQYAFADDSDTIREIKNILLLKQKVHGQVDTSTKIRDRESMEACYDLDGHEQMIKWLHSFIDPHTSEKHIVHKIVEIIQQDKKIHEHEHEQSEHTKVEKQWTPEEIGRLMAKQPIQFVEKGIRPTNNSSEQELVVSELKSAKHVFDKFSTNPQNIYSTHQAASIMIDAIKSQSKLLSCGNGGSYSDAQHFASELSGKYRGVRPAIAALALSDGGAMSCIANDFGFNHVFERQVEAIGRTGDVLLCLSTSGNSENVILAAKAARSNGIKVIGIGGNSGGRLSGYCDVFIDIPHSGSADRIQELSITIIHILVNLIEKRIA